MIQFQAKVRLYFNRHGAAPLVWCIAADNYEIAVTGFGGRVAIESVYRPKATPDDEDGKPSAWLETMREVRVSVDKDGFALLEDIQ